MMILVMGAGFQRTKSLISVATYDPAISLSDWRSSRKLPEGLPSAMVGGPASRTDRQKPLSL
jgi:hypothetical protein